LYIFFGVVAGAAGGGVNVKEQAMQGGGGGGCGIDIFGTCKQPSWRTAHCNKKWQRTPGFLMNKKEQE
jgi:hypothetical protein